MILCEFSKIFETNFFARHVQTGASKNGSIKSNNAIRSLSKSLTFLVQNSNFFGKNKILYQISYEVILIFVYVVPN